MLYIIKEFIFINMIIEDNICGKTDRREPCKNIEIVT